MMRFAKNKILALLMALAMVLTMGGLSSADAATASAAKAKKMQLSKKKVTLQVGASVKIKVKNAPKGAKIKWSVKSKKIAGVSKTGKITGKKVGSTKVTAKVTYKQKGKKVTKNLKVSVKVEKKKSAATTVASKAPASATKAPQTAATTAPTSAPQATATTAPTPAMPVYADQTNLTESHKSANGVTTEDNGMMRQDMSASELMLAMGQGYNLANTLESCGIDGAKSVNDFETGWGAVRTTRQIINGIKAGGFNNIRIPVAWSNMISDDGTYTIDPDYLKRVEEVVNYSLSNEMYVIINIHYDGDWWGQFGDADPEVREQAWARFESFWTQIANYYKEYSDRLIFESANEELGDRLNDDWVNAKTGEGNYTGTLTQDECYTTTNEINQKFVDIVRGTGGNNEYRHLLIAGYNTDVDMTCDDRFKMPTDSINGNGNSKLSVSVHYYTPSSYCISEDKTNETWYTDTWGTEEDIAEMRTQFEKMTKFTKEGYGVILGEYGPQLMAKKGVPQFLKQVMLFGIEYGYVPILWNTSVYNRTDKLYEYSDIADVYREITGVQMPLEDGPDVTGTTGVSIVEDESAAKLVASWEGAWTRTNNVGTVVNPDYNENDPNSPSRLPIEGEVGGFTTDAVSNGLEVMSNAYWWQMFMNYDWSTVQTPCIRLTLADDEVSQGAAFQLGYTTQADGGSYTLTDFDNAEYGSRILTMKLNKLSVRPWLAISSSTPGATITKVEIFDLGETAQK